MLRRFFRCLWERISDSWAACLCRENAPQRHTGWEARQGLGRIMKKKIIVLLMAVVLCALLAACGNKNQESGEESTSSPEETGAPSEPDRHHVEITVKDYGKITVELYKDEAPITVENFLKLAKEGFYDGLTFHRILAGFMIQGGDPEGTGMGGSDETIKGEFSSNGVPNDLSHTRGAISMARTKVNDSASSQFFIVQQDSVHLDGDYACFGYVTEGMDVVDAICEDAEVVNEDGYVAKENQPVIESIVVID